MAEVPSAERYLRRTRTLRSVGDPDAALEMARAGLVLHPASADLHTEVGEIRLVREEYVWARGSFERSLALEPGHEKAMVGLGRVLLRFGEHDAALSLFERVVNSAGPAECADRWMEMARALYNEGLYRHSRDLLVRAIRFSPGSAETWAALGYAVHRLGDEMRASAHIRRALEIAPDLHDARIHLAHHLFDQGDREEALREFLKVPLDRQDDPIAVLRIIEVMRAMQGPVPDERELGPWHRRLDEIVDREDAIDRLFADMGAVRDLMGTYFDPRQLDLFIEAQPEGHGVGRMGEA